jgi:hypothetical protein
MMGSKSHKILRADASGLPMYDDAISLPVYESKDLDFFQCILNDIVEEFESIGQLSINDKKYLKSKLAVAIFRCADAGDRDYARLKTSAIEAVSAVPFSDPGP